MDPELLALLERLRAQRSATATHTPPLEEVPVPSDAGTGILQTILQGGVKGLDALRRGILQHSSPPATPASRTAGRVVDRLSEAGRFAVQNELVPTDVPMAIEAAKAMTSFDRERISRTPGTLIPEIIASLTPVLGEIQAGRDVKIEAERGKPWGTALAAVGMLPAVGWPIRAGRVMQRAGRAARSAHRAGEASRAPRGGSAQLPDVAPPGHIRVYRGIGPERNTLRSGDQTEGRWFTTQEDDAIMYANWDYEGTGELGPNRAVTAVDIPIEEAFAFARSGSRRHIASSDELLGDTPVELLVDDAYAQKASLIEGDPSVAAAGGVELAGVRGVNESTTIRRRKEAERLQRLKETGFADEIPGGGVEVRPGEFGDLDTVAAIKRAQQIVGKEKFEELARADVSARGGGIKEAVVTVDGREFGAPTHAEAINLAVEAGAADFDRFEQAIHAAATNPAASRRGINTDLFRTKTGEIISREVAMKRFGGRTARGIAEAGQRGRDPALIDAMSGTEDTARRIVRERDALTARIMGRHNRPPSEGGGGSTTHARTGVEPTEGYGVSTFKDREVTVDNMTQADLDDYIQRNSDLLDQDDVFLGTWRDTDAGKDVIDVSQVVGSRAEALRMARASRQDAIWDFANQKEIRVPGEVPNTMFTRQLVSETPNTSFADGRLTIDLERFQNPAQSGTASVRSGVFFLPIGSRSARYFKKGDFFYGGTERKAMTRTYSNPLIVRASVGGKGPERAFIQLKGKKAFAELEDDIQKLLSEAFNPAPTQSLAGSVWDVLAKHGGDADLAGDIVENHRAGNRLRYAVQENIVAKAAEDAGYDAVISFGNRRKTGAAFINEVFDVTEKYYPLLFIGVGAGVAGDMARQRREK